MIILNTGYTNFKVITPHCVSANIINESQLNEINELIKRMLYSLINKCEGWFAVYDIVGKMNKNWKGCALQQIYEGYINIGEDENSAYKKAARDVGIIIKNFIIQDEKYYFEMFRGRVNMYRYHSTINQ